MKTRLRGLTIAFVIVMLWAGVAVPWAQVIGYLKYLRYERTTVTVADNGGGTSPTQALTTSESSYQEVDCQDANGCTITVGESGAREGQQLTVCQISASPGLLTFADSSGTLELLNGTSYVTAQWECLELLYVGDRWMETSRTQFAGAETSSSVATLTQKTIDAEGSGNSITIPFTETILAASCESDYSASSYAYLPYWRSVFASAPTPVCIAGSNVTTASAQFPDSGTKILWNERLLPSDWAGAINILVHWRTSVTSGNVVWQYATACVANSEGVDPTFNTTQTVTDAALGTTFWRNVTSSTSLTTTGCAADETFYFKVFRDPTHASDTLAATAELLDAQLTIRRTM